MSKRKIIGGICLFLAFAGLYKAIPDTIQNEYVISYTIGRFTPPILLLIFGVWYFSQTKRSPRKKTIKKGR